jgi:hypothetical protein
MIAIVAMAVAAHVGTNPYPPCDVTAQQMAAAMDPGADAAAIAAITCIGPAVGLTGAETLPDLPQLVYIEDGAFENVTAIVWDETAGAYPALEQSAELCGFECPKFSNEVAWTPTPDLAAVTCIPAMTARTAGAADVDADILLNTMPNLVTIGTKAFFGQSGHVKMEGVISNLREIASAAFARAALADELTIDITGAPALRRVGERLLGDVYEPIGKTLGTVRNFKVAGDLTELRSIGKYAFPIEAEVTLANTANLEFIGERAFANTRAVTVTGNLPNLATIGEGAFRGVKSLNVDCLLSGLKELGAMAFNSPGATITIRTTAAGNNDLTNIPEGTFFSVGSLTFSGTWTALETLGGGSFAAVGGIVFDASCPALKTILPSAFGQTGGRDAGVADGHSVVTFDAATCASLETMHVVAFGSFAGAVIFAGALTSLETIGANVFYPYVAGSKVTMPGDDNPIPGTIRIPPLPAIKTVVDDPFLGWEIEWTGGPTDYGALEEAAWMCGTGCPKFLDDENVLTPAILAGGNFDGVTCIPNDDTLATAIGALPQIDLSSAAATLRTISFCDNTRVTMSGAFPALVNIGPSAFQNSVLDIDATFPALKVISYYAFAGADGTVILGNPTNLERIGSSAFSRFGRNEGPDVITISNADNLKNISGHAFADLDSSVTLTFSTASTNLEDIGEAAFRQIGNAESEITINPSANAVLRTIALDAFRQCDAKVTFGGAFTQLEDIETHAFSEMSHAASSVDLSASTALRKIGYGAFKSAAASIKIVGNFANLAEIGSEAFQFAHNVNVQAASVSSLQTLGHSLIAGGTGLLGFICEDPCDNNVLTTLSGRMCYSNAATMSFAGRFSALTELGPTVLSQCGEVFFEVTAPALTTIGSSSFSKSKVMFSLTGASLLTTIGDRAFQKSSGSVTFDSQSCAGLQTIGVAAFHQFGDGHPAGAAAPDIVFAGSFPSLVTIMDYAFGVLPVTIITFEDAQTSANALAFPDGLPKLKTIGDCAFAEDMEVSWAGDGNAYPELDFSAELCGREPPKFTEIPLAVDLLNIATATCVKSYAFKKVDGDVDLSLAANLKTIGCYSFYDVTGTVTDGGKNKNALTAIGYGAFQEANGVSLTGKYPELVTIGNRAFYQLNSITIDWAEDASVPSLETIGPFAFYRALTSGDIKIKANNLKAIKEYAFMQTTFIGLDFSTTSNALEEVGPYAINHVVGPVRLTPAANSALKVFGPFSLSSIKGPVVISGFSGVEIIGDNALIDSGRVDSEVNFEHAANLRIISEKAFKIFKGHVSVSGALVKLETVGDQAFYEVGRVTFGGTTADLRSLSALGFQCFGYRECRADDTCSATSNAYSPDSEVTLTATKNMGLVEIPNEAFVQFPGKLVVSGAFEALETINNRAFSNVVAETSSVTLAGETLGSLSKLTTLGASAFAGFGGTVTIDGTFGSLSTIGASCFGAANKVLFSGEFLALTTISASAFANVVAEASAVTLKGETDVSFGDLEILDTDTFAGFGGTVTIEGTFDSLRTIGASCFRLANKVDFDGVFPVLTTISASAFANVVAEASAVTLKGETDVSFGDLEILDTDTFAGFGGTVTI